MAGLPTVGPAEPPPVAPPRRRDRRQERHEATRQEILAAAWEMVRAEGVAGMSLRGLARSVGVEPQSLYSYFDSKHAIYDAMFADANAELLARLERLSDAGDPIEDLRTHTHEFARFCTEDAARYQLLFQRTIPGFEPSAASYGVARRVIDLTRRLLERAGVADARALDMFTGIFAGLVSQQLANDPGGDRWVRLLDEAIDMFFQHIRQARRGS